MKFVWVTMIVNDIEKTVGFYEDIIGLKINRRFKAGNETEIVFLGDGDTQIELIHYENGQDTKIGNDISLGFQVESLDKMMIVAKEKELNIISEIIQPNPHIKFFYVKDPNGAKIQFVENM